MNHLRNKKILLDQIKELNKDLEQELGMKISKKVWDLINTLIIKVGQYYENNMDMNKYVTDNPHNEVISILTQLGLFGILVFFTFIYYLVKDFFHTDIGKSVIIIITISCMFNSLFYDNIMGIFAVLIISYAMQKKITL